MKPTTTRQGRSGKAETGKGTKRKERAERGRNGEREKEMGRGMEES